MPNMCSYALKVKGKKESVEEFVEILKADYNYTLPHRGMPLNNVDEEELDLILAEAANKSFHYEGDERHFYRVFEAYDTKPWYDDDKNYCVEVLGECAWSVASCMFEDGYYRRCKAEHGDAEHGTTVPIESERLGLDVEIYSEECGCEFQEHYVIKRGEIVVDDVVDYQSFYVGDFDTKKDAEDEYYTTFTDEEWDKRSECDDCIIRGGFEWEYTI